MEFNKIWDTIMECWQAKLLVSFFVITFTFLVGKVEGPIIKTEPIEGLIEYYIKIYDQKLYPENISLDIFMGKIKDVVLMINDYFYELAKRSAQAAAEKGVTNIDPRWIYAQWIHESNDFTSALAVDNHNLGGVTQSEPNDTPQPDGGNYYINFASYEDYADYFGHYLYGFVDGGVDQAKTLAEYVTALKNSPSGEYFGDSLENYLTDCQRIYDDNFGG